MSKFLREFLFVMGLGLIILSALVLAGVVTVSWAASVLGVAGLTNIVTQLIRQWRAK